MSLTWGSVDWGERWEWVHSLRGSTGQKVDRLLISASSQFVFYSMS